MSGNQGDLTANDSANAESTQMGVDDANPVILSGSSPRFGLLALFYATAVVAAAVAFAGIWGIVWAIIVCFFWIKHASDLNKSQRANLENVTDRPNAQSGFTALELVIVIVIIGLLIGVLLPAVSRMSPQGVARVKNMNRMRQLLMAMHNYESVNQHFPPAYVAGENGKPMHSWRVLLLPYLEEDGLFDRYDFDEPWNGPNNSKLVDQLDDQSLFFQNEDQQRNHVTGFKLVTGPETAFDKDQTIRFGAITAGSSSTIALVDDTTRPVNWMSPEDVTIDQAVELFDAVKNPQTGAHQLLTKFAKRTFFFSNVGFLDGSVLNSGALDDPAEIREHFTIRDFPEKEYGDLEFLYRATVVQARWDAYLLLVFNIVLAVLPAFWMKGQAK